MQNWKQSIEALGQKTMRTDLNFPSEMFIEVQAVFITPFLLWKEVLK